MTAPTAPNALDGDAATPAAAPTRRTPLHGRHVALGAKIVPFAGFDMPVQYPAGITAEHKAVRERCGVFDVSHMGEFVVRGPQALELVNYVSTNDASKLAVGQAHYSTLCNERGTVEDDCLVYRYADRLMLVVNASNKDKDLAHVLRYKGAFDCTVDDVSDDVALLAVQGPDAEAALRPLTAADLPALKYYWFAEGGWPACRARSRAPATPARTASSCTARPGGRASCGTRSSPPAASRRAGSARATRCGWRWAWRSTATTSTTPRPRSRPTSPGW
jgi:hypothetical protein